jgi:uncharacterized protein
MIYAGHVGHTRLRPRRHALRYRIFMLLLDLDDLGALAARLRWFSLGRFNLLSFHPTDHGDGSHEPLRRQVQRHLAAAGLSIDGGAIRLLCMPRVLGYGFNPISLYFCHRPDGELAAVLYEVTSTFGERHSYLIPHTPEGAAGAVGRVAKRLHVSPFMDMALRYTFRVSVPSESVRLAIDAADDEGVILTTRFAGRRRPLTDRHILAACLTHPLLTLKVIAAIHWEALKLLLKGVPLRVATPAPQTPVTVGRGVQAARR